MADQLREQIAQLIADETGAAWDDKLDQADRILSLIRAEDGWMPIESAPKDGTRIILAWGGASVVGFYLDNSKTNHPWQGWKVPSMEPMPRGLVTHWRPLPSPPKENTNV